MVKGSLGGLNGCQGGLNSLKPSLVAPWMLLSSPEQEWQGEKRMTVLAR